MEIAVDVAFGVVSAVWLVLAFRPAVTSPSFESIRGSVRWGVANGLILALLLVSFLVVHDWPEVPADLVFMVVYPLGAVVGFVMLALILGSRR